MRSLPGVAIAAVAVLVAFGVHALVPAIPLLTASVVLGVIVGQMPVARPALDGVLKPGLTLASKRFMRIGVVLLGLKLSLVDIAGLGWELFGLIVAIVLLTFGITFALGRLMRLPGDQPLLIATGFAVCGASAIGAMSAVTGTKAKDAATPVALVTLFGTLAIAVLPALQGPLGLSALQYGQWVGASVHDVGQVVATAQIAGASALAIALVVKLTRVLVLAPMVAVASVVVRTRGGSRPPVVPLFVVGFVAAMLLNSFVALPAQLVVVADLVQTVLLALALFALGTAVRLRELLGSGARALLVGLASWVVVAGLALGAVRIVA